MSASDRKTILLVEDEIIAAMAASKMIQSFGYDVVMAETGEEAIDIFKSNDNIDLVLMDIDLGSGIDGTEAAAIILKCRDIPVVFLSSHTEPEIVEKTEKITSYGYVVKGSVGAVFDASIKMAFKLFEALKKERKKEQALRKSEHDLLGSQRLAHVGSWYLDVATNEVFWTEELYKMYGFDPALPPPPYTEHMKLFTPQSWELLSSSLANTRQTGIPYELELVTVRKDGLNGWMWVRGEAVFDENGRTIGLWGAAQDITERKRVEEALRESEELLNETGAMAKIGGWKIDLRTQKLTWTKEVYKLHEVADDFQPVLETAIDFYDEDCRHIIQKAVEDAIQYGIPFDLELGFITARNNHLFVRALGKIRKDNDGKTIAVYGTFQDITERRLYEAKLESSNYRLNQMSEHSRTVYWEVDAMGLYTYVNDISKTVYGLAPDEIVGKKYFYDLTPQKNRESFKNSILEIFSRKEPLNDIENEIELPDGNSIWVSTSGRPFFNGAGDLQGYRGTDFDITNYKLAQEALQASLKDPQLLAEAMPQIVWITRADGWNIYFNQQWVDYTGLTLEESYGNGWNKPFHPDDRQRAWNAWQNAVKNNGTYSLECRLRSKDGMYHWWLVRGVPVVGENGQILKWFGTCTDIDQVKQSEEKIKTLLSEKELILKEVHHRIKNNMNTVASLMLLQMDTLKDPSAVDALNVARSRVMSMMVLYDKLYRSEAFKELSFKEYLSSLIEEIINNFPNKDIVKLQNNIDDFTIDARKMSYIGIIVNELLTNAMKYAFVGRQNGSIKIDASKKDKHLIIVIHDDGLGISEKINVNASSGFGLQLVDMMVRQLRGSVRIERDNGTKFILEIYL